MIDIAWLVGGESMAGKPIVRSPGKATPLSGGLCLPSLFDSATVPRKNALDSENVASRHPYRWCLFFLWPHPPPAKPSILKPIIIDDIATAKGKLDRKARTQSHGSKAKKAMIARLPESVSLTFTILNSLFFSGSHLWLPVFSSLGRGEYINGMAGYLPLS